MPRPESAPNTVTSISVWAQSSMEMQRKQLKKRLSNTSSIATNGFMVQAYQVPDMQTKCTAMQPCFSALCGTLLDPPPGVLNSRERLRAAVIGGRTARGVVGTLNTRERWSGSRPRAGTFDTIIFVASTLIGTMSGAYRPGNCAAAR